MLLWLAVRSRDTISDATILDLTRWLIATEQRRHDESGNRGEYPNHWLLRTTFTLRHDRWIALGKVLAAFAGTGPCGDAVRDVGRRLSGEILMRSAAEPSRSDPGGAF